MRKTVMVFIALIVIFLISSVARGEVFKCKGLFIKEGFSKIRVLELCGDPEYILPITYSYGNEREQQFYYKRGNKRFIIDFKRQKIKFIGEEKIY